MRTPHRVILSLSVVVVALAHSTFAQDVGDIVVVTADNQAELKSGKEVVTSVPRGTQLSVERVQDNWYWVEWNHKKGWINNRDVVPLEQAVEFFTEAILRNPNADDFATRGLIRGRSGQNRDAVADLTEAIRLAPENARFRYSRGIIRDKLAQHEERVGVGAVGIAGGRHR